ncbi:MAG: Fic family protein [bacterium]
MTDEYTILSTIRDASDNGLAMRDLVDRHPDVSRRTLQRLVNELIEAGRIEPLGAGPARRYMARSSGHLAPSNTMHLSPEALDVREYVRGPIPSRAPVGYQREFLDAYTPGQTFYLDERLRNRLRRIGSTGAEALPAGTYGRGILDRLLIDLSWASSNLEGNTYSLLDTRELIAHGRVASGKDATETQMILNHKAAIELLVESSETIGFDRYTLLNLHAMLSENLLPNPADEGRVREIAVAIGGSVYTPLSVPSLINSEFDVFLAKAGAISDPFEQAFFAMVHLPYLQPFADVNKRTSRLAANIPLIKANLVPLTFLDVPPADYTSAILGVYEMTRVDLLRDVFVWAYERSAQRYSAVSQELAEPDPLRLAYRDLIKNAVREIVLNPERDLQGTLDQQLSTVTGPERDALSELVKQETERLHPGVLARYGLRPSEFDRWRNAQGQ